MYFCNQMYVARIQACLMKSYDFSPDFFPKRKRILESKLDERTSLQADTSSSLEVTPRKTIR